MSVFAVVVAGVPGTGKTSVARILASELSCLHFNASERAVEKGLASRDPSGRATRLLAPEAAEALTAEVQSILEGGRCVIIDTHYPSLFLEALDEHVALIIVLRCNPLVLMERLSARGWPRGKVVENVLAEAFSVIYDELADWLGDIIEVDTTGKRAFDSAMEALDLAVDWKVGPRIDWMAREEVALLVPRLLAELDSNEYGLRL